MQQEVWFRLSQGNYFYGHDYAFLIMIISAMDGRDRDLQGRQTLPESWGLEGEREAWLPRVGPLQARLRAAVFPLLQGLVKFYTLHIFHAQVLNDLLRFACGQILLCQAQGAYQ